MKKLILSTLLIIGISISYAQRYGTPQSVLTIQEEDGNFFQVTVKGRTYNSTNGVVSISSYDLGVCYIQIARPRNSMGAMQEVYRGRLVIPAGTHLMLFLTRYSNLETIAEVPLNSLGNSYAPTPIDNTPQYPAEVNIPALVETINNEAFDKEKLMVAKQALRRGNIYAAGVERIMRQFSFDDARLEFAKYAYKRCIDPQNYYRVNNAFTFDSNKEKLNNFILKEY